MRSSPRLLLAALGAVLLLGSACGSDEPEKPQVVCGDGKREAAEACDDGNSANGDGCQADCTVTPPTRFTQCWAKPPAALPDGATCAVTKAGTAGKLFTGTVLTDGETFVGGQVLVDAQGIIQCAACDCANATGAAEATQVLCPTGVISPGLINPHDHITYPGSPTASTSSERYEHRHDWRVGANKHTRINNPANAKADAILWSELRQVMAGTTSIAGAGGQKGLLRNLDVGGTNGIAQQEGLAEGYADSDTFPLGDSSGTTLTEGCSYSSFPVSATLVSRTSAYLPHIAEGIATTALNEFRCLSTGSGNVLFPRAAIIHGVGLTAREISEMAAHGTALVWSPRSNVSLYGDTAMVTTFKTLGVPIALGTDWIRSGSMNILRELRCADHLNTTRYAKTFTDEELWRMVTSNAADLVDVAEKVGRIAPGKVADLAIYRLGAYQDSPHRAVIAADPQDVVLTMRGGKPLYGDQGLVDGLKGTDTCDALDVCGTQKAACLKSEITRDLATFQGSTDTKNLYPLFACGAPANEPSCEPKRSAVGTAFPVAAVNDSTVYTGVAATGDSDADGIPAASDNCPIIFNPVRPLDNGRQLDTDGDGAGDACDPCPLEAGTTACVAFRGEDDDRDGVATWRDNCPFVSNADQKDTDADGKGDACDGCPAEAGTCSTPDPSDFDYDNVLTPRDNCPLVANADQKDTDADGVGDACDACPVANPDGTACALTVYDVKTTPTFGNTSLVGAKVVVDDVVVTGVDVKSDKGYWVQVARPPAGRGVENSGLFIFAAKADVAVGDNLKLEGTLKDYFGLLELIDVTVTKHSAGNALPAPVVVRTEAIRTGGPQAKALEGTLVEVRDVVNTRLENKDREFIVDENASGDPTKSGLMVDDQGFAYPTQAVGTLYRQLRGLLTYGFSNHKLVPRGPGDMLIPLPALTGFTSGGYARVGGSGAIPQALTVTMASVYPADVTIPITSSDPSALKAAGGQVVIPAGQTSATVALEALAPAAAVELTATLDTSSRKTTLRVLGTNEPASITGLTPQTVGVAPGGTARFTVTFDRPVPAGTTLGLSVSPSGFGTFANQTVVTDTLTATFDLTLDDTATGSATVSLTDGVNTLDATVNAITDVPRLTGLSPSTATVNAGAQQVYTVTLESAPTAPVQVLLTLTPPAGSAFGSLSDTSVTVPVGQTSATVTFTAAAEGDGMGTVAASLNGITRTASLTVLPPPAKLASLTPDVVTVTTGKTQVFTVTLDRKAPAGGATVDLALDPSSVGTIAPTTTVTVPAGQTTATVTFTAAATAGTGQLTASYASVSKQSAITVKVLTGADHVVISEIAGQGLTVNADDFIELFNPTDAEVDISGWKLLYRTASTTSTTTAFTVLATLPTATIKPHSYFLVAGTSYSTAAVPADHTWGNTDISGATGNVRLGTGSVGTDPTATEGVIDTVGFGTGRTVVEGAAAPAPPGKGGSTERKALAGSTAASMSVGGADAAAGNGYDSDDNSVDFLPRTERQPQNAQSPAEQP
ncbi:amidohydrolase family protein [Corallococcus llansteffanensis]|uniref:Amidohydrolase n=1 Tax=Corallococcus llansteffanensis TaxID=2316731 RepID=A0A3A8PJJ8_9BACT|nr:amidohydrolase family protein [Corallococcus llansteffanensis]RKH54821.1 amidohydrolase [Corallococcus llansteffanensis]